MLLLFAVLVCGTIAGAYFYVSRMRASLLDEQRRLVCDLVAGGQTLKTMSDEEMHQLHMNIHEELKRRMSRGS